MRRYELRGCEVAPSSGDEWGHDRAPIENLIYTKQTQILQGGERRIRR
jgi:hypothetical protein